ncbi:hypothetical protein [Flavobacterium sp. UGB4466]|uniref:hypothetical protein n=1 Tax=Flavobacterium sp. UGB4466 TaxID=2730889 RepID=UPI00192ACC11|nr:hypothetical protein [Flavobacterium sp. UGB4466]
MKKLILLLLLLLFVSICSAQTAVYNKITSEADFISYQTKSNNIVKTGDTLQIGYPRAGNQFTFISQANIAAGTVIANSKVVISKIKTVGNNKRGYKTYLLFKGYGLYPVYIDYESALETGEVKAPFNKG